MEPAENSTIRIALLGFDDATPALAQAILASDDFELAGACEFEADESYEIDPALAAHLADARPIDSWEALLDLTVIDAVVVARGANEDRRADQLRKLIQAGVPLLVSHPVVDSMLVCYELDMIRREALGVVVPHLPWRRHPAISSLAEMLRQGDRSALGKIEQVVIERCIAHPAKPTVFRQFARDVDMVRAIAGEMTRLGALAGSSGDSAYTSLGVHLSGAAGVVARWSVVPSRDRQGAKITLLGSSGKAVVETQTAHEPWTMERDADGSRESLAFEAWNPAAATLETLARALGGQPPEPNWVDAAHCVELAETIDRSLQKGRTIELHFEEYTEEGTFKGTMTSVGCGLLVLGMLLMAAVGIGEQMGFENTRFWPYLSAGVLGLFLLLQLLMFVFRRPASQRGAESAAANTPSPAE